MRAHPLEHAEEDAEADGVEEVDAGEVDHDPARAQGRQPYGLLAELRCGGQVELTGDGQHGTLVPLAHVEIEEHQFLQP